MTLPKTCRRRCLCCSRYTWDGGTCGKCMNRLVGHGCELQMRFTATLVARDGSRWYVFRVQGGGVTRLRKLHLLAVCSHENDADRAALAAMGNPGIESEDAA